MNMETLIEKMKADLFSGKSLGEVMQKVKNEGYSEDDFKKALIEIQNKYISGNDEYI